MYKILLSFLLSVFVNIINAQGQTAFSNQIVKSSQWEDIDFTPFAKGKLEIIDNGVITDGCSNLLKINATTLLSKIKGIIPFLKSVNNLNPPQGINVRCYLSAACHEVSDLAPIGLTANVEITINAIYLGENEQEVKTITSNKTNSTAVDIYFNDYSRMVSTWNKLPNGIYPQPALVDTFGKFPVYEVSDGRQVIVVSKKTKQLFSPVDVEKYVQKLIFEFQFEKRELEKKKTAAGMDISYAQHYKKEKQQRKTDFEKAYNVLMDINTDAAAELKKTYEETEKIIDDESKNNPDMQLQKGDEYNGQIERLTDCINVLKTGLQNMTPEEKGKQAYYTTTLDETNLFKQLTGLTTTDTPDVLPLIKMNPDLFNKNSAEIQLIVIEFRGLPENSSESGGYYIQGQNLIKLKNEIFFWSKVFELLEK